MKLTPAHFTRPDPSRARCDALTARLSASRPPTMATLQGAALNALQAAGLPFGAIPQGKPRMRLRHDGGPPCCVAARMGETPRGRPWLVLTYHDGETTPGTWRSWEAIPAAGLTPAEIETALSATETPTTEAPA